MQKFDAYICRFGAIAVALISLSANADPVLVDVRSVDPTITVDLRYANRHNFLGHSLYPRGTHALVRPEIASALAEAQSFLRRYQYGLKIWDAYRPVAAQAMLWEASHNSDYVANPEIGAGSLHSWGIAVDATLVDSWNRPVSMPSDLDAFTPAATLRYTGPSLEILGHVRLLQWAMHQAGFWGIARNGGILPSPDWKKFLPRRSAGVRASPGKSVGMVNYDRFGFLRGLRQPEYVHVLLNPLPVYGLLVSWIALIAALISKSRRAHIVTLILVFVTSISAWPVYEFGEEGYDRVLTMTDDDGHAWLDEHQDRAQKLIYLFYLIAALSAAAIIVPLRWPKSSVPLAVGSRNFSGRDHVGRRLLHRIRGRQNSSPRISQRTSAAD